MPKKNTTTPAPSTRAITVEPTANALALPPAAQIVLALLQAENATTAADLSDRSGLARSTVTKSLSTLLDRCLATRQVGGHDGARRIADRWFAASGANQLSFAADDAAEAQPGADTPDDKSNASAAKKADSDSESTPNREGTDGRESADRDSTNAEAATAADAAPAETPQAEAIPAAEDGAAETGNEDTVPIEPEPDAEAGKQNAREAGAAGDPQPAPVAPDGDGAAPRLGKGALRAMVEAHLRENPDRAWTPSAISKVLGRSAGAINNACLKLTETGMVTTFPNTPVRFQWNGDASPDAH